MAKKRVKLSVIGITFSQIQAGAYALILEEEGGARRIPIIIGTPEAQSIAIRLEGLHPPRPLTHDIFISFMQSFDIQLKEVFIHKFEDGVFFSNMLFVGEKKVVLDARTSDAISIAIRYDAPIYTTEDIVLEAGIVMEDAEYDISEDVYTFDSQKKVKSLEDKTKEELQSHLNEAIAAEDYEAASRIRDEMSRRFSK
ncbi:MAG: bifunctional nuclease family protein [Dysgonamonadaceae bacterium]|jgi:bifunctional DNase/RNase|nr:bifunctional nuclease family protein [Dysgonamonadaceae bacterium]